MKKARHFPDQIGNTVALQYPPEKIISLVPSQTELLADLGLSDEVIGITRFCVHPVSWRKTKAIIGGTKKFDFKLIDELQPDLIIGNKEENYFEGITELSKRYPVWMSDIVSLEDAFAMIMAIGELTARQRQAEFILKAIRDGFESLKKTKGGSVLYMIWHKPWMAAGKNTFIDSILTVLGLTNIVEESRYPELTLENIIELNPDYVFLSSEPYPFREKHVPEMSRILPQTKVILVDGEMFSWYGSRLIKAPEYFNSLQLYR